MVLFNYKNEDEEEIKRKIEELWTDLDDYVKNFEGFSVVIGVSEATGQFKETKKMHCRIHGCSKIQDQKPGEQDSFIMMNWINQRRPVGTINYTGEKTELSCKNRKRIGGRCGCMYR